MYLHANIELKERALAKTDPFRVGRDGIVRPTSCWPSCKPSDYAELKNEKKERSLNEFEEPLICRASALDVKLLGESDDDALGAADVS